MRPLLGCLLLFHAITTISWSENTLQAKGYQSITDYPDRSSFPELRHSSLYEIINSKPNTAIGFTGGGARAYVAGLGQLSALTDLGLMKKVRYIGGISGGGWLSTVYTYSQLSVTDDVLLGPIVSPEELSRDRLNIINADCARSFADRNITRDTLKYWLTGKYALSDAWGQAVADAYLHPAGILDGRRFSVDDETVADIKRRNPTLEDSEFYLPRSKDRPFYIVGSTIVGPVAGAPFKADRHNFTMLEITPLYIGQMQALDVRYTYNEGVIFTRSTTRHIGGAIEPFAFGGADRPSKRLLPHQSEGVLTVNAPDTVFDLKDAACATSFAPGAFLESIGSLGLISKNLGLVKSYWSPSLATGDVKSLGDNDFLFGDGGSFENIPLINFIQRRVEKIVLFFNSETPLESSDTWAVESDEPSQDQVSDPLPAFFGVFPPLLNVQERSYEYGRNQIFATRDYITVVKGLQAAQELGRGIIFGMNLTTIQNDWWGIPAGITQEICFVYLGRVLDWEALLSDEMKGLLVPMDTSVIDNTKESGPFIHFPNYDTYGGDINAERANALADLTGWVVNANRDLFERLLG